MSGYEKLEKFNETIEEIFSERSFIEALVLQAGAIDSFMKDLIYLNCLSNKIRFTQADWDYIFNKNANDVIHISYYMGIIREQMFRELLQFNALRNRIIKKVFIKRYEEKIEIPARKMKKLGKTIFAELLNMKKKKHDEAKKKGGIKNHA